MGKGLLSMALSPTMDKTPTSDDVSSTSRAAKRRAKPGGGSARGARVASNSTQQQRQRARLWDRIKDAEDCLIELTGDDGAELKAE
jgi:hypothetical protein